MSAWDESEPVEDLLRSLEPPGGWLAAGPWPDEPGPGDEDCEVCGEGDGPLDDVVATCWDGRTNRLAHVDCATATGWTLA